jgi:hypothetical protein
MSSRIAAPKALPGRNPFFLLWIGAVFQAKDQLMTRLSPIQVVAVVCTCGRGVLTAMLMDSTSPDTESDVMGCPVCGFDDFKAARAALEATHRGTTEAESHAP